MLSLSHRLKAGQLSIPRHGNFVVTDGEEGRFIRLKRVIISDKQSCICSERDDSFSGRTTKAKGAARQNIFRFISLPFL